MKRPPTKHPLLEYERDLNWYRPGRGQNIVCDRWHLGEVVYPAVLKRESQMDLAVTRHVSMFLRSRGALVVVMNPELQVLVHRVTERGDDLIKPGMLTDIHHGYDALEPWLVDFRYRNHTPDPYSLIVEAAEREAEVQSLAPYETYVGPPRPKWLLVGQTRGVNASQVHTGDPAFGPYRGTSGHWLLSALQLGREEPNVGIANACDVDDVTQMWKALGEPRVAALGQSASQCLYEEGIPHGAVPHPQYIRRFYNKSTSAYSDAVWAALHEQSDLGGWRP